MAQGGNELLMVRQPIFDRDLKIVAYQLRYHYSDLLEDSFSDVETEGSMLVMHTFTSLFQDGQLHKAPVFLPFPDSILQSPQPLALPHKQVVVELHPGIEVNKPLLKHLLMLRKQGYRLALDQFSLQPELKPLLKLVHIVKVDFSLMHRSKILRLVEYLKRNKLIPLAQNVDDFETLKFCQQAGFRLFQGRFISRPVKVLGKQVPGNSAALIQLLQQLQRPDITPAEIQEFIVMDPKLSFKMLRVVNSAAYQLSQPIDSMQQAVVYLGHDQIKKWATLITLSANTDKPEAVIRNILIRGRMCELLAESSESDLADSAFMTGMVSQLDLLLDVQIEEILRQLPLTEEIKAAVADQSGFLGELLRWVTAYEQADWETVEQAGLDKAFFEVAYRHSLHWSDQAMEALSEVNI